MELSIPPSPILENREELLIHQCKKIISVKETHGLCSGLISTKCLYVIGKLMTKLPAR
ncbi:hypothetical protein PVL29_009802 [Vitis rotundifolia]|uniref:Uncharacterized protein n=1 Tax=Vitis rotundifolia TaxID=103349 RepID=A0AA38ZTB1_VITRO|nr:hypothetical protein PVL29_009802 [Vitis rotundifolia]